MSGGDHPLAIGDAAIDGETVGHAVDQDTAFGGGGDIPDEVRDEELIVCWKLSNGRTKTTKLRRKRSIGSLIIRPIDEIMSD